MSEQQFEPADGFLVVCYRMIKTILSGDIGEPAKQAILAEMNMLDDDVESLLGFVSEELSASSNESLLDS